MNVLVENSNSDKHVIAATGIDKHKLLTGFTGKLHFCSLESRNLMPFCIFTCYNREKKTL